MDATGKLARFRPRSPRAARRALAESLLLACAFSAGVHIALTPEHFGEAPLLGLAFLAVATLLMALGLGIYLRPHSRHLPLVIVLLSGALVAAYAASRTIGLPVVHPTPEPLDTVGLITKAVEAIALALSLRLFVENAAGFAPLLRKRRTRWTTISPIRRAGL
jgi:hypothetical protein